MSEGRIIVGVREGRDIIEYVEYQGCEGWYWWLIFVETLSQVIVTSKLCSVAMTRPYPMH